MDNRQRAREWLERNGLTRNRSQWAQDRDREALTAAFDSVRREALTEAADRVAAALQGVPMCGETGCAEVAACDVRRVEAEIRALAHSQPPDDETKEDGRR